MGLTAFNRQRQQAAAGEVTKAEAHLAAAEKRVADLKESLAVAETHLARCQYELDQVKPDQEPEAPAEPEAKPVKKKAASKKKTAKKKASKKKAG